MSRQTTRSTRTATHFPYTTLFRSIGGADANRLSRGRFLELLEARHPLHRDADRNAQRDERDDREAETPAQCAAQPQAPTRRCTAGRAVALADRKSTRLNSSH